MEAIAADYRIEGQSVPSVDVTMYALLTGNSQRTAWRYAQTGKIAAIKVAGQRGGTGGENYRIPVAALPVGAQVKLRELLAGRPVDDVDLAGYKEAFGEAEVVKLFERYEAVMTDRELDGSGHGVGERRQANADQMGVSQGMIRHWRRKYETEGLKGLMKQMARSDKGKSRGMCQFVQDFVEAQYYLNGNVTQNRILGELWEIVERIEGQEKCCLCDACPHNPNSALRATWEYQERKEWLEKTPECREAGQGIKMPTTRYPVNNYIKTLKKSTVAAARLGMKYWDDNYLHVALRKKPELVNECWFGDHHVFDLFVLDGAGKPKRVWLTAWMDAKSSALVGWVLSMNPNSHTIIEALEAGMIRTKGSEFSGRPLIVYIDNGKDYRCKLIEGDGSSLREESLGDLNAQVDEHSSLLKSLGIGWRHAKAYNARAKPIERMFRTIEQDYITTLPGYCGNKPGKAPNNLKKEIKEGALLTFEQFCTLFVDKILPGYNNHIMEAEQASPLEIYRRTEKACPGEISYQYTAVCKAAKITRKVFNWGFNFFGRKFDAPELHDLIGERVTLLYNYESDPHIGVLYENRYVCEAYEVERMHMYDADPDLVAAHMREQAAAKKALQEELRFPDEKLKAFDGMVREREDLYASSSLTSIAHERIYRRRAEAVAEHEDKQAAGKRKRSAEYQAKVAKWVTDGRELLDKQA